MISDAAELEGLLKQKTDAIFGADTKLLQVATLSRGQIEISANVSELETAIAQLAKREAAEHGVTVDDVRLNFREAGPRALETEANVRARKMFLSTTIRITGRLEIDDQLTAAISNLNCSGDGAIGSMACGFLAPQLAKLNGRTFPLASVDLGARTLRDVQLSAGERLTITADFSA